MIPFKTNHSPSVPKNKKAIIRLVFYTLLIITIFIGGYFIVSSIIQNNSQASNDNRVSVKGAKAKVTLNRDFEFPVKDNNGKELTRIKFSVTDAELRDEIILKGKRAVALQGRTFLIFSVKITNSYEKALDINTRSYLRISVNGNKTELMAPDIHNDPVSVQAISTKTTRVGLPINDTDTALILLVGEVSGEKQEIPIEFP